MVVAREDGPRPPGPLDAAAQRAARVRRYSPKVVDSMSARSSSTTLVGVPS
jgi:hypothetical protein